MKSKVHNWSNNPLKNKFIVIPTALLVTLMAVAGPKYAPQIKDAIQHAPIFGQKDQTLITFPKEGTVTTVVDGDTVYLHNGERVRYMGINSPGEKASPILTKPKLPTKNWFWANKLNWNMTATALTNTTEF